MIRICIDCGEEFEHETHSWCFACKIQGVTLGHVPNHDKPSRFQQERDEVAKIRAKGEEPVRVTGNEVDKRDKRKPYEPPRRFKKWLDQDPAKIEKAHESTHVTHDDRQKQYSEIARVMDRARG